MNMNQESIVLLSLTLKNLQWISSMTKCITWITTHGQAVKTRQMSKVKILMTSSSVWIFLNIWNWNGLLRSQKNVMSTSIGKQPFKNSQTPFIHYYLYFIIKQLFEWLFVSQCEAKSENVCIDVTETKCEVSGDATETVIVLYISRLYLIPSAPWAYKDKSTQRRSLLLNCL